MQIDTQTAVEAASAAGAAEAERSGPAEAAAQALKPNPLTGQIQRRQ